MLSFIVRRLLLIVPTVFGALSFLFILFFLLPGDPASLIAGGGDRNVDPGVVERIEARYGLDEPMPEQFVNFWKRKRLPARSGSLCSKTCATIKPWWPSSGTPLNSNGKRLPENAAKIPPRQVHSSC